MTGLVLEGIDPNKCGFNITDKTLTTLKQSFLNREYKVFEHDFVTPEFIWRTDELKDIQTEIPQNLNSNLYNSEHFFDWFRNFDLKKYGIEMVYATIRELVDDQRPNVLHIVTSPQTHY